MTSFKSMHLQNAFTPAVKSEASKAVRDALAGMGNLLTPEVIEYLRSRLRNSDLENMRARRSELRLLRASKERKAAALAGFIEYQFVPYAADPFLDDKHRPAGADEVHRWAARQLHDYGRLQSIKLGHVACQVADWCIQNGAAKVLVIDSPVGGTIPAAAISYALTKRHIVAIEKELLTPRLGKHSEKYSIRQAAETFCEQIAGDAFDLVLFPDEVLTGSRFRNLLEPLRKTLGVKLVPLGLAVRDFNKPVQHDTRTNKFKKKLLDEGNDLGGAPVLTEFPPALLFSVDKSGPLTASAPFFWAEVDLCAGKRKVNLIFAVINEFRELSRRLCDPGNSVYVELSELWSLSADGTAYAGIDAQARRLLAPLSKKIDWPSIQQRAAAEFPEEYKGNPPTLGFEFIADRLAWIRKEVLREVESNAGQADEASCLWNALENLFSARGGERRTALPSGRDFCDYTIPYGLPVRAFHEELVRLVKIDVDEACARLGM